MKTVALLMAIVLLFLLISCSKQETITGDITAEINTVRVAVVSENGTLIPGAEIYINDEFKGKTSKYGRSKGTKTIILNSGDEVMTAKHKDYTASEPVAIVKGEEIATIVLEKEKTDLVVAVRAFGSGVRDAEIELYESGSFSPEKIMITNSNGRTTFKNVDDGEYILIASKTGLKEAETEIDIDRVNDGDIVKVEMELTPLPKIHIALLDEEANPLEDALIEIYTKKMYNIPAGSSLDYEYTNDEGWTEFGNVEYGESYIIVIKKEDYHARIIEHKLKLGKESLRLEMEMDVE